MISTLRVPDPMVVTATFHNLHRLTEAFLGVPLTNRVSLEDGTTVSLVTHARPATDFSSYAMPSDWAWPSAEPTPACTLYQDTFLPHGTIFQMVDRLYVEGNRAVSYLKPDAQIWRDHMGIFPGVFIAEAIAHTGAGVIQASGRLFKKPLPYLTTFYGLPGQPIAEDACQEGIWVAVEVLRREEETEPTASLFMHGALGVGPTIFGAASVTAQVVDTGATLRDRFPKF